VQVAKFDSDAVAYREVLEVSYISVLCNTDIIISHNKLYTCISKCVTIMGSIWRSQFFQIDDGNMHNVSIQVESNLLSVLLRHTVQFRKKKQDTKHTCACQNTHIHTHITHFYKNMCYAANDSPHKITKSNKLH